MKRLIFIGMCLAVGAMCAFGAANEVSIAASVNGPNNSATKKECKKQATKLAVAKYLAGLDANMDESIKAKAMKSYAKWVDEVEENDIDHEDGEMTGQYSVTIKDEELLQFLSTVGWSLNSEQKNDNGGTKANAIEIVIVEEQPDEGMITLAKEMGTGQGGKAAFFQRYPMFQRRVRDRLVKQIGKIGLTAALLEDNEAYADLRKYDPVLVGGTFDVKQDGWVITRERKEDGAEQNRTFIEMIRDNNPDTLVLYYRIDTIAYNTAARNIRTSVSMNLKTLGGPNGIQTMSLGALDAVAPVTNPNQMDIFMADIAVAVTRAMGMLINGEGMNDKVAQFLKKVQNAKPEGVKKVVINASKIDPKIRTRAKVMIKKEMIAVGMTNQKNVKTTGNTISATLTKDYGDADELWIAILEILEKVGIEDVTDDQKTQQGTTLTVTPGSK